MRFVRSYYMTNFELTWNFLVEKKKTLNHIYTEDNKSQWVFPALRKELCSRGSNSRATNYFQEARPVTGFWSLHGVKY